MRLGSDPVVGRRAVALAGAALLTGLLSCALGTGAEPVECPNRVVHIKVPENQIAGTEEGASSGHQPWHSDPHIVVEVALAKVESGVNVNTADSIPYKRTILSPAHQLFRFEFASPHHIDEISVRRLRWRNHRTGKTQVSGAWWATKAVISDCSMHGRR